MLSTTRCRVKVPLGASIKSKDTTPQSGASCPCFILLCAAVQVDSSNTYLQEHLLDARPYYPFYDLIINGELMKPSVITISCA